MSQAPPHVGEPRTLLSGEIWTCSSLTHTATPAALSARTISEKGSPVSDMMSWASPSIQYTALPIAFLKGNKSITELLIKHGVNVNATPAEKLGATALQFAAIDGYLGIAHILIDKGADVNAPPANVDGRTALEGAAEHGRIYMVQLLKNAGADVSEAGGGQWERAMARAYNNCHYATRRLLMSFLD